VLSAASADCWYAHAERVMQAYETAKFGRRKRTTIYYCCQWHGYAKSWVVLVLQDLRMLWTMMSFDKSSEEHYMLYMQL